MKSSEAYKDALAMVRANPYVQDALGSPIEAGLLVAGNINISDSSGYADLAFPVSGPDGSGTVYVVALTTAQITLPYPFENRIRRLLEKIKATITDVIYKDHVVLIVEVPENMAMELVQQIGNQSQGQAQFNWLTR